ncbi:hypothetical protein F4679DRAFT_559867 [Xylaria curta]|nr:hypothetical protein F4679DRAFT_559867 [Xylaria curta]
MNKNGEQAATPLQHRKSAPSPFSQRAPPSSVPKLMEILLPEAIREGVARFGATYARYNEDGTVYERTLYSCPRNERESDPNILAIGFYDSLDHEPSEVSVDITNRANLFWKLKWGTLRLRGLRTTFLSLKSVKSFRLYECCPNEGFHRRIDLPADAAEDMRQLVKTYKLLYVPSLVVSKWADWIAKNINEKNYALEIVFDWSPLRVSIALLAPLVLSLVIGLWFNSRNWNDPAIIQTAWGIASYIVTAASLFAALLAVMTTLMNKAP